MSNPTYKELATVLHFRTVVMRQIREYCASRPELLEISKLTGQAFCMGPDENRLTDLLSQIDIAEQALLAKVAINEVRVSQREKTRVTGRDVWILELCQDPENHPFETTILGIFEEVSSADLESWVRSSIDIWTKRTEEGEYFFRRLLTQGNPSWMLICNSIRGEAQC